MSGFRLRFAVLALLFAAAAACNKGNPVASPTEPSGGGSPDALTVTVSSDFSSVEAGSTAATMIHVSARRKDGSNAPDNTEITLSTSLGGFGSDASGKPIQLTKTTLAGGRADVPFFPGSTVGVANILVSAGTAVATLNLPVVAPPPPPTADFTFSANGLTVLFTDASTNATTRQWSFGDGTASTEKNPTHIYSAAGTYTVTLTTGNSGGSAKKSQFVTVSLGTPPVAAFTYEVSGTQVNFVDKSTGNPTSFFWNFGDGISSNQHNPIHAYSAPGVYTVTLTASNAAGSSSTSNAVTIAASPAPAAAFTFSANGKQVNFVDKSTGNPTSWVWNFGDGTTSKEQNPVHAYGAAGNYTVTLTVSNASGADSATQVVTIAAGAPPVPAFSFVVNGYQVNFVDKSTGNPTSYSWDFGDGATSTQPNPIHVYGAPGTYTVVLTVANAGGSATTSDVVKIVAPDPPQAAFTFSANKLLVNFVDQSTGNPTSYFWNFGDGTGSNAQNPIHAYNAAGTYTVTLTVSNANGSTKTSKPVTVTAP